MFISKYKFQIISLSFVHPIPLWEHNVSIMSMFQELPSFSTKDCEELNRYRQYLQVTSLADITTGDGKKVRHSIMQGLCQSDRVSILDWGIFYPTQREKNKWIKAMRCITIGNTSRLLNSLGK